MVSDWITNSVKGKRVLDLFSANGGFSLIAALAGAKEVVGVEYSQERIQCAEFVINKIRSKLIPFSIERKLEDGTYYNNQSINNNHHLNHHPFTQQHSFSSFIIY